MAGRGWRRRGVVPTGECCTCVFAETTALMTTTTTTMMMTTTTTTTTGTCNGVLHWSATAVSAATAAVTTDILYASRLPPRCCKQVDLIAMLCK